MHTDTEQYVDDQIDTAVGKSIRTSAIIISGSLLGLLVNLLNARIFGAETVGIINLGITIITITDLFLSFGLERFLVREIPRKRFSSKQYFLVIAKFEVPVSVLASLLIFILSSKIESFFDKPGLGIVMRLFAVLLVFNIGNVFARSYLVASGRSPTESFIESIAVRIVKITAIIFVAFLIPKSINPSTLAAIFLLGGGCGFLLRVVSIKKKIEVRTVAKRAYSHNPSMMYVLGGSFSFFIFSFTYYLIGQVDRLFVGKLLPAVELGAFTNASTLAALVGLFSSGFIAFWPEISRLYSEQKLVELQKTYRSGIEVVIALSIPIVPWVLFNSEEILSIFGNDFAIASLPFAILVLGRFVDVATGPVGAILVMTKYTWVDVMNGIAGLCLTIVGNWFLVPRYGMVGAAIATSFAIGTINIVKVIEVWVLLKIIAFSPRHILYLLSVAIGFVVSQIFSRLNMVYISLAIQLLVSYSLSFALFWFLGIMPNYIRKRILHFVRRRKCE